MPLMNKVNSFTGFDKLNEVWLGGVYPSDFYYDFDPEARDAFVGINRDGFANNCFSHKVDQNYLEWVL